MLVVGGSKTQNTAGDKKMTWVLLLALIPRSGLRIAYQSG